MQVHIDTKNNTVTMSIEDFINHFSGIDHQLNQQPIPNLFPVQKIAVSSNVEESITSVLNQLGVPRGISGFTYLRESITMAINNPDIINYITKDLYPSVAKKFGTTPSRAERAIRHAIEISWNRADVKLQGKIFGCSVNPEKGKAKNSEFIAAVSDCLRIQLESKATIEYETADE